MRKGSSIYGIGQATPEERRAYLRAWRSAHPQKNAEYMRAYRARIKRLQEAGKVFHDGN